LSAKRLKYSVEEDYSNHRIAKAFNVIEASKASLSKLAWPFDFVLELFCRVVTGFTDRYIDRVEGIVIQQHVDIELHFLDCL